VATGPSHDAVRIKRWVCHATSFRFESHLGDFHHFSGNRLHVSIHGTRFSLLFSKLSKHLSWDLQFKFRVYVHGLRLGFTFGVGFWGWGLVRFYQAYCSPLHTRGALLSHYRWQTNKFLNMKVHRRTYNHCLTINVFVNLSIVAVLSILWLLHKKAIQFRHNGPRAEPCEGLLAPQKKFRWGPLISASI